MSSQTLQSSSLPQKSLRASHPSPTVNISALHSTDEFRDHGTSHHHEDDGYLTGNAFIENVILSVFVEERRSEFSIPPESKY